jgi:PKD repeat protein
VQVALQNPDSQERTVTVTLEVTDNADPSYPLTASASVMGKMAGTPLVFVIPGIVTPLEPTNNSTVTFSAPPSGGSPPYTYAWDFGDGASSAEPSPTHTYAANGTYSVKVTVTDSAGNQAIQTRQVIIGAQAPRQQPGPFGLGSGELAGIIVLAGFAAFGVAAWGTQVGRYFLIFGLTSSVFSRIKRPSPLDHFVRGRLYQLLCDEPGVHYSELRRRANLSNGAAAHHLRVLEKAGIVRVVVDGTRTRFYPTDKPLEEETYGLADGDRALLTQVAAAPGISESELARQMERSLSTINRSVERLAALGYVTTRHEGRTVSVFPREGDEVPRALGSTPWPIDELP